MEPTQLSVHAARIKRAELLSSVGAGVLGAGLALLAPVVLQPYTAAILAVGLLAHGWGMYRKHQLERNAPAAHLWWARALYGFCWLALAALAAWIALGLR
jgi:hypothetical protein